MLLKKTPYNNTYIQNLKMSKHSWARTPQILRARGIFNCIKFVHYYNGIRRLGEGVISLITLTPCVPRYVYKSKSSPLAYELLVKAKQIDFILFVRVIFVIWYSWQLCSDEDRKNKNYATLPEVSFSAVVE